MFNSFNWNKTKLARLDELPLDTKAAILAKNPCTIFEYTIKKDIQGKISEKNGIFFKIPKIEIICFNTGICFLSIKTNIGIPLALACKYSRFVIDFPVSVIYP